MRVYVYVNACMVSTYLCVHIHLPSYPSIHASIDASAHSVRIPYLKSPLHSPGHTINRSWTLYFGLPRSVPLWINLLSFIPSSSSSFCLSIPLFTAILPGNSPNPIPIPIPICIAFLIDTPTPTPFHERDWFLVMSNVIEFKGLRRFRLRSRNRVSHSTPLPHENIVKQGWKILSLLNPHQHHRHRRRREIPHGLDEHSCVRACVRASSPSHTNPNPYGPRKYSQPHLY